MIHIIRKVETKIRSYYFLNEMTDIKNLNPKKITINKNSYKNILVYYTGYVTVKNFNCKKIKIVNPL